MLAPDDVLQNRYRIVRRLGHGGMGAVYEALDPVFKRIVAVKETFATAEEGRKAFSLEAQRLANLDHEAFPKVFDHFADGEGLYLVMQLIRGDDLEERLTERLKNQDGPFSTRKVLEWADQLLDALEELHKYRPPIIHRDIKPSNLKLNQKGKIILLDFGIAKGVAGQMSTLKTDGSIGGATPYFAPLEQVLRIDPSSIKTLSTISHESVEKVLSKGTDPRSDLYSLGATLYRLLTGEVPDDARLRAMAVWAGGRDPLQPAHQVNPQVSPAVSDILMQAMALERGERPADAMTMRRILGEAVGAPVYIPPTIPPPEELERQRREEVARRRAEAETERLRREEEERHRTEEETRQREAEAQREREAQEAEAARRAEEERRQHEAEAAEAERKRQEEAAQQRAEEERQRQEAEESERREAANAARRAEAEERQRAEQERLGREAEAEERKLHAEREEKERATAAQQTAAALTQPAQSQKASGSADIKTIEAPAPEKVFLHDALSGSASNPVAGRGRQAILIGATALLILVVVAVFALRRSGESPDNQSSNDNQTQTGREGETTASNANAPATPPAAQSSTPPLGMTFVPGGEFILGRNDGDEYERPAHKVTVKPFFIDIYEVTREDYKKCLDAGTCPAPQDWINNNYPAGTGRQPVTGVIWDAASAYANWAGKRLPTEEEWEFAARGGDQELRYPWGNEWGGGLANANSSSNGLAEVGSYKGASPFGAYDMVGNAWEWTASKLTAYQQGQSLPNKPAGELRVIRGGSYIEDSSEATTTYRRGYPVKGAKYDKTGFRCAQDIASSSGQK